MKYVLYLFSSVLVLLNLSIKAQVTKKSVEELFKSCTVIIGNDSTESLPINYQRNNVPFIKVIIDGKEYFFLFDTGASGCFISNEIAGNSSKENSVPVDDNNGTEVMANVVLKNINIGKSSFSNIACVVGNTKRLSDIGCVKIDGIIGTNLIKLCNWKLDPTNQIISFSKQPFKKEENSSSYNIEFTNEQLPLIKFNYDNISFYALIDSGFSDYFELNDNILRKSKKYRQIKRKKGFGQYALTAFSINSSEVHNLKIDTIYANSSFFSNIPTNICHCKPTIGSALLKRNVFVYNFSEKQMIFTPIKYDTIISNVFDIGIGLNDSNEIIISFIWESEFSKKSRFEIGQRILKIDNIETGKYNNSEFCELRNRLELKNELKISVLKGKEIKDFIITKQPKYL
ncbi:MAG: retroviral-like aspartic protease family protein [Bacteroidia bacterium]|nr:retroviral-like aspartic protease family protein [Bacteroidia bacterium]